MSPRYNFCQPKRHMSDKKLPFTHHLNFRSFVKGHKLWKTYTLYMRYLTHFLNERKDEGTHGQMNATKNERIYNLRNFKLQYTTRALFSNIGKCDTLFAPGLTLPHGGRLIQSVHTSPVYINTVIASPLILINFHLHLAWLTAGNEVVSLTIRFTVDRRVISRPQVNVQLTCTKVKLLFICVVNLDE